MLLASAATMVIRYPVGRTGRFWRRLRRGQAEQLLAAMQPGGVSSDPVSCLEIGCNDCEQGEAAVEEPSREPGVLCGLVASRTISSTAAISRIPAVKASAASFRVSSCPREQPVAEARAHQAGNHE